MTAPPLFKVGDRVRTNYFGEWYFGIITHVHPPTGPGEPYRYDFRGDEPSFLVCNTNTGEQFELLTPLVPMAKDLTLRELLIIQFLPGCLTIAKRNNSHPQAARIDLMRCAIVVAGGYADLYLEARTKVGGAV